METQIYTFLMIIMMISVWVLRKNKIARYLVTLYCAISIISSIVIARGTFANEKLELWAYIFLIICYFLFFLPFLMKRHNFESGNITFNLNIQYEILLGVYIIATLITLYCFIPSILDLIQSGEWNVIRDTVYADEVVYPYSNFIEYISVQISSYAQLLVLIIAFTILCYSNEKRAIIFSLATIILSALSSVCIAIYAASRGQIFLLALVFIALLVFYYDSLNSYKKMMMILIIILGIIVMLPYLISVTVSRFSDGAIDSVIEYFGQPPIVFNYGVSSINEISLGKYAFGQIWGYEISQASIGGSWGTGFYTFIGWLYIDWGMGTVLVGIACALFFGRIISKRKYKISDVYIVFLYLNMLLNGVLVIGRGYYYTILMGALTYFIVKIFFDKVKFVSRDMCDKAYTDGFVEDKSKKFN